jgi:hypothetical protein
MTSGEIPTTQDFEEEVPVGRISVRDGHVCVDPIEDYQMLTIKPSQPPDRTTAPRIVLLAAEHLNGAQVVGHDVQPWGS